MTGPAHLARGVASLQARARVVEVALWAFLVVAALGLIGGLVMLSRTLQLADPPLELFAINSLIGLAFWVVLLLGVVPVLAWVHRAHANLHDAQVGDLAFSPGWATGSYLVPVANLWVPFHAMRELYNRSNGEPADFAQIPAGPVNAWWSCHIPAVFLTLAVVVISVLPVVSNVWITAPPAATMMLGLFGQILWMGSAWFLRQTVRTITAAQGHGVGSAQVFA